MDQFLGEKMNRVSFLEGPAPAGPEVDNNNIIMLCLAGEAVLKRRAELFFAARSEPRPPDSLIKINFLEGDAPTEPKFKTLSGAGPSKVCDSTKPSWYRLHDYASTT